jgi:RNA polymerase primary sigma factor
VVKEALKQLEKEHGEPARDFAERLFVSRYHRSQYMNAKNQMTSSNLRLVVSVAKKFRNRGLPFLDLIQEGSKGVMKAADAFEWRKGYKFSTYAMWWIRQYISRAVQLQPRVIHIPLHAQQSFSSIARSEEVFIQNHQRPPSDEELATVLQATHEEVRRLIKARRHSTSLNIATKDGGEELGDTLPSNDMENDFHESDIKRKIEVALDTLTFREREIIKLRYGIADGFVYTLEEVGKIFKVTRERIRQIEEQALRKLKHPSRSRYFQDLDESDKN